MTLKSKWDKISDMNISDPVAKMYPLPPLPMYGNQLFDVLHMSLLIYWKQKLHEGRIKAAFQNHLATKDL